MEALKQNPKEQKMSYQKFSAKVSYIGTEDREESVRSLMKTLGGRIGQKQCRQIYDEMKSLELAGARKQKLVFDEETGKHFTYALDLRGRGLTAFVEALLQKFGCGANVPKWLEIKAISEPMDMLVAGFEVRLDEIDALCAFMGWNPAGADVLWDWLVTVAEDPALRVDHVDLPAVRRDEREAA